MMLRRLRRVFFPLVSKLMTLVVYDLSLRGLIPGKTENTSPEESESK
jgi:hypothetical protein